VIDSEMKAVDPETDIPESLRKAYFELLRAGLQSRLAADDDYKLIKGSGKTPFLDRI